MPILPDVVGRLRAAGCVFAEEEAALLLAETDDPQVLESLVARRVAGEPLEHVLGRVEFAGLRLAVGPGVFVPRQRTALLVREAVAGLRGRLDPVLVDLCCGCGAIAAAVLDALPHTAAYAADLDPAAVASAHANLDPLGAVVLQGDLYAALPDALRGGVDVLAVNAPYVPTHAVALMPPEARDHEARLALDGGSDGLDVHRRVVAGATAWVSAGGMVVVEVAEGQATATVEMMRDAGLEPRVRQDDDLAATVVVGELR